MNLDCCRVTTEIPAIGVFFFIVQKDSVVLITLTAFISSIIVDNEWEVCKPAVSVNLSSWVTVHNVFHSDGWSPKAVFVFVVFGGIVRLSSQKECWGSAPNFLAALLTCIVKWGKRMRQYVVSMTIVLGLLQCITIVGPVKLLITAKSSARVLLLMSKIGAVASNGFSNWPFATLIWKFEGLLFSKPLAGPVVLFCLIQFGRLHWINLLFALGHLWLGHSRNSKWFNSNSLYRFWIFMENTGRYISMVFSTLISFSLISGV